jgi:hypothetical protein
MCQGETQKFMKYRGWPRRCRDQTELARGWGELVLENASFGRWACGQFARKHEGTRRPASSWNRCCDPSRKAICVHGMSYSDVPCLDARWECRAMRTKRANLERLIALKIIQKGVHAGNSSPSIQANTARTFVGRVFRIGLTRSAIVGESRGVA